MPFTRLAPLAAALLVGCATVAPPSEPPPPTAMVVETRAPVTILISIDGFRPDYLDRGLTPHLSALARGGVLASMRPAFPSKTFPNHWTLVTGLIPDHHGIVANSMEDAARPGEKFTMETFDPWWWGTVTPIWVDAEHAGLRTATMFWPGANVAVGGRLTKGHHDIPDGGERPADWHEYSPSVTNGQRVLAVLDWMRRPAAIRPHFVTLYFDRVDSAGHDGGPNSPDVNRAIADVDAAIGALVDGLAEQAQPANLVVVADHGMAETRDTRVIVVSTLADPADFRLFESGPYASFYAVPGHEHALEAALLRPHAHVRCWPKAAIPARFRYGTNPRVPPYLCLADTGWLVKDKPPEKPFTRGDHGYDNQAPEMRALFLANGPAFAPGRRLPAFDNVDVASLLRDVLGLPAKAGDGDDAPFRGVLRR